MNYLSHSHRFLDDPYFVAGVCTPDWIRVFGKSFRAKRKQAEELLKTQTDTNSTASRCWMGIIQHHTDDEWFHQNETFVMMSAKLAVELGMIHGRDESARSMFLGHIVIELLLDSVLLDRNPRLLDKFYESLLSVDGEHLQSLVEQAVGKELHKFGEFVRRFHDERFLADYGSDDRLMKRLNQVIKRVGLAPIGEESLPWLAQARCAVERNFHQLLPYDGVSRQSLCFVST